MKQNILTELWPEPKFVVIVFFFLNSELIQTENNVVYFLKLLNPN